MESNLHYNYINRFEIQYLPLTQVYENTRMLPEILYVCTWYNLEVNGCQCDEQQYTSVNSNVLNFGGHVGL